MRKSYRSLNGMIDTYGIHFGVPLHPEQKSKYPLVQDWGSCWHIITKPDYYMRDVLVFPGRTPGYFEYRTGCTGAMAWGDTFDYYGKCIAAYHMGRKRSKPSRKELTKDWA